MKNFSAGSGSGTLKSQFTSTGTTGPALPTLNTLITVKKFVDPASSHLPHKCPNPVYINTRERQRN